MQGGERVGGRTCRGPNRRGGRNDQITEYLIATTMEISDLHQDTFIVFIPEVPEWWAYMYFECLMFFHNLPVGLLVLHVNAE